MDAITDSVGNLVQKYQYSAFGKVINILDASDNIVTSNPKVGTSFTFTGREFDKEADLYFYRARVYDPNTGRFLQQDPDPGKMMNSLSVVNKYSYALNNPVLYADPTGKSIFDDIAGYVQVFIGAIVNMVVGLVTLDPARFLFGVALAFEVILAPINLIRNGRLPKYETYEGMPVVKNSILSEFSGRPGFSLGAGSFVAYDPIPSRLENTIQHEYGHYLQYQAWGPWDYLATGWEQKGQCGSYLENDADYRAGKRFPGFQSAYGECH